MNTRRTVLACLSLFLLVALALPAAAQPAGPDLVRDLKWRNIGPANMSGRISDIEALDADFSKVLVATASGGVFKSINAGTTWEPIFDRVLQRVDRRRRLVPEEPRHHLGRHGRRVRPQQRRAGATASTSRPTAARRSPTWASRTPAASARSSSTRPTPTSSTWRPAATRGATPATAACSRRSTAARPGRSSPAACRTTGRRAPSTW